MESSWDGIKSKDKHAGSTEHNDSAGSHNDPTDSQNGSPTDSLHRNMEDSSSESPSGSKTDDVAGLPIASKNFFSETPNDGLSNWREPVLPEEKILYEAHREKIRRSLITSDHWNNLKALLERRMQAQGWESEMEELVRETLRKRNASSMSFDELALLLRNSYKDRFKRPDEFCKNLQIEILNRMKQCYESNIAAAASDSDSSESDGEG